MKKAAFALLAFTLAGCASAPRPQVHVISHPVVKASPAIEVPSDKPATFNERFRSFTKKHPRWFR